jgi:phosphinothricin acetyltransferase
MDTPIRLARSEDAPTIQAIYAPVVAWTATSFELTPATIDEIRQCVEQTLQTHR